MVQFTNQLPEYDKYDIGDGTYGNPRILWSEQAHLVIGKYCSIAEGVVITLGGNHRVDWVTTYPFSSSLTVP
jgi:virginiamycin A acetyltransferase